MLKIGSHVSNKGKDMLVGSINEAISYDSTCFMVYLGAPQNTFRRPIGEQHALELEQIASLYNIDLEDMIVHAPYIVNLAQTDFDKHEFAVKTLSKELRGVALIGAKYMVLHPGAHLENSVEVACERIADGINQILDNTAPDDTVILLETMAGKGTEVGRTFEEIKSIIDQVKDKSRIGVCIDTCHINDGGYDIVNHYEDVIEEFDRVIGLKYVHALHVNDSKNPCGSHKDRHENFGCGYIGFDTLMKFINDKRFEDCPKILETPYVMGPTGKTSYPPYREEIAMIRSGKFDPNIKKKIIDNALNK